MPVTESLTDPAAGPTTELTLTRDLPVSAARLFALVTTSEGLLSWWGPEGMHIPEGDLDFSREGPWYSVMQNGEGQRYKVSGYVTHVRPPASVGLTWGWHDETDTRGHESHVTLTVTPLGDDRARLTIHHVGLTDDEAGRSHEQGWNSTLNKLESILSPK